VSGMASQGCRKHICRRPPQCSHDLDPASDLTACLSRCRGALFFRVSPFLIAQVALAANLKSADSLKPLLFADADGDDAPATPIQLPGEGANNTASIYGDGLTANSNTRAFSAEVAGTSSSALSALAFAFGQSIRNALFGSGSQVGLPPRGSYRGCHCFLNLIETSRKSSALDSNLRRGFCIAPGACRCR